MSDVNSRIANLSPAKRALLAERLHAGGAAEFEVKQPRASGECSFPLSSAQERIWFDHQWNPGLPLYNDAVRLRISGRLQVHLLRECHRAIVLRHEIWRTRFEDQDGTLRQIVCPSSGTDVEFENLRHLDRDERERCIEAHTAEVARAPYLLEKPTLHRIRVLQVDEEEYVLLFGAHHIVFDAWSVGIYLRELLSRYAGRMREERGELPELPFQYGDFAVWQRARLSEAGLAEQLAYWKAALADIPPVLQLPLDHPRPLIRMGHGSHIAVRLEPALTAAVRALAIRENTTTYSVLLAGFGCLLHRYSEQRCVVVGTPVNFRNQREFESLIGVFVNSLALALRFDDDPGFDELARQVRDLIAGGLAHKDLPFEGLIEALQPERDLGRTPIFQVLFDLQKAPKVDDAAIGLRIVPERLRTGTSKCDLNLALTDWGEWIGGDLEYDTALFEASTIRQIIRQWEQLLREAVAAPATRASAFLSSARLPTGRPESSRSVLQLFQTRVAESPEAPCITADGRTRRYREVWRDGGLMALRLQRDGNPVALRIEPSYERVVAELAVLLAGGICTDVEDAGGQILTRTAVSDVLSGWQIADDCRLAVPDSGLDEPAWIVANGVDNAVSISHRDLAARAQAHARWFRESDRVAMWHLDPFSLSAKELWPALLAGACVEIGRQETLSATAGITVAHVSAAMAGSLLAGPSSGDNRLRLVFVDPGRLHRRVRLDSPLPAVWAYASPLAGGVAVTGFADMDLLQAGRHVARECSGAIEVRDRQSGRFVSEGISGELVVHGVPMGVSARRLSAGRVEFLPAAEMEAALLQDPSVEAAVVTDDGTANLLVGDELWRLGLQRHFERRLPAHLRPRAYARITELRLSAEGQAEFDAEAETLKNRDEVRHRLAPRDERELTIAGIWEDVLKTNSFGVQDNFFELGGHSMLASRVNSLLAERLGVELPIRALFENPTIAELAEHVEAVQWALAYVDPIDDAPMERGEL